MKKIIFLIFLSLIAMQIISQNQLDLRKIEQEYIREIEADLYVSKYEVWNGLYLLFLSELKIDKQFQKFEVSKIDSAKWILEEKSGGEILRTRYHCDESFLEYPVVNISYDGAVYFCEWLTEKYNAWDKRKFKKVIFRLPTEQEWIYAAIGKHDNSYYPWHGPYLKDSKGNYRCKYRHVGDEYISFDKQKKQFKVVEIDNSYAKSPFALISPIDAYEVNDFGLFNICGNVAEMTVEKGVAKGGHWNSPGYDLRVDQLGYYAEPSPYLGFRFFVEIIEE